MNQLLKANLTWPVSFRSQHSDWCWPPAGHPAQLCTALGGCFAALSLSAALQSEYSADQHRL